MKKNGPVIAVAFAAAVTLVANALAADYPTKPVTIVVPFPAGGSSDILARFTAEALQRELGKPFVVENRTGAGGVIGTTSVAKSAPDGYTLLLAVSAFAVSPYTSKITYDPEADFEQISIFATTNFLMVVSPQSGINSVSELVARAKARPNELTFGSAGVGTAPHLYPELLDTTAGIKMRHIPYRGNAPALVDLMSGQITMCIMDIASSIQLVREGKLKALGVTSGTRDPDLPDVPSIGEAVPGYDIVGWQGLMVRSGTPKDITGKLYRAVDTMLHRPDTPDRFRTMGFGMKFSTPDDSHAFVKQQLQLLKKVVTDAGIVPE